MLGLLAIAIMKDINIKAKTLSDEFNAAEKKVHEHKRLLDKTAETVIAETTKIKPNS